MSCLNNKFIPLSTPSAIHYFLNLSKSFPRNFPQNPISLSLIHNLHPTLLPRKSHTDSKNVIFLNTRSNNSLPSLPHSNTLQTLSIHKLSIHRCYSQVLFTVANFINCKHHRQTRVANFINCECY